MQFLFLNICIPDKVTLEICVSNLTLTVSDHYLLQLNWTQILLKSLSKIVSNLTLILFTQDIQQFSSSTGQTISYSEVLPVNIMKMLFSTFFI